MSEEKQLNIYQKLVEIRKNIVGLDKDSQSFGYEYVSGTQILRKIKGKMDELGVVLEPHVLDQAHETYDYVAKGKEKTDFIVTGKMNYVWVNADKPEEKIVIPWEYMGQQDDISKAFGSGLTYSERYFLMKYFGIPTDGDDPDKNNTSDKERNSGNQNGGNNSNQNRNNSGNRSSGTSGGGNPATEKQLKAIDTILKEKINDKWSYDSLFENLQKQVGTQKELKSFTFKEASKALDILKKKN
jgi:hypothetical protein